MMKSIFFEMLCVWMSLIFYSCGGCDSNLSTNQQMDETTGSQFALGADIGWCTEYEAKGYNFYNSQGQKRECTALMKELGLDAIRIRVWVDPSLHGNWCNLADVLEKAKRAKAHNMDVMIDFHYSDWWADPGQQHKPVSWKGFELPDLKEAVRQHTCEVLNALKQVNVEPKWVQVGNEIRPGLLWDEDARLSGASYDVRYCDVKGSDNSSIEVQYPANWSNLTSFINIGYEAVKSVFPESVVIVHLDNGWDAGLFNWFFDELKKHGGKWDMIGMSVYPFWTQLEKPDYSADKILLDCIQNINALSSKYGCDVMVVEIGMECADDQGNLADNSVLQTSRLLLSRFLKLCRTQTQGRCKGVFYWEPECRPSQYRLGAFTEDGRATVIMNAFSESCN